jgi:phenylpyruvate tautomerase PptA (4-oxalocrotonate tautomerase family)
MPVLTIRSNAAIDDDAMTSLLNAGSASLAATMGQPEAYVMTLFERADAMTMAATSEPCCLVDVRSVVELTADQTKAITAEVCSLLSAHLDVRPERVFVNFTDFRRAMWGFNGSTLA